MGWRPSSRAPAFAGGCADRIDTLVAGHGADERAVHREVIDAGQIALDALGHDAGVTAEGEGGWAAGLADGRCMLVSGNFQPADGDRRSRGTSQCRQPRCED
jgi:hypothetical protein